MDVDDQIELIEDVEATPDHLDVDSSRISAIDENESAEEDVDESLMDDESILEETSILEEETGISTLSEDENVPSEVVSTETNAENATRQAEVVEKKKLNTQFPLGRVKSIMKMDADCQIVSREAVALIGKATELFVRAMGAESIKYTKNSKRKTLLRKDVNSAVDNVSQLSFLEGALD